MGKRNSWKVNETQWLQYLGHSKWNIFSLSSWFFPKMFPPFYPASHNKPSLITPERGRKENGKREFLKSQWNTVVSVPGAFKQEHFQSVKMILSRIFSTFFTQPTIINHFLLPPREEGRKWEKGILEKSMRHSGCSTWGIQSGTFSAC